MVSFAPFGVIRACTLLCLRIQVIGSYLKKKEARVACCRSFATSFGPLDVPYFCCGVCVKSVRAYQTRDISFLTCPQQKYSTEASVDTWVIFSMLLTVA